MASTFNYVLARVRGMIGGWAEKELSCVAREVLLKANVQAVPTYPMLVFKLALGVCQKLTSAVSNYWWGSSLDNHRIHRLRWEKLTRSKEDGGMGFRDFALFNKAMLGKQGWRLLTRRDSLCARVLFLPGTREWDVREVQRSFMAFKVAEVLKIKPSSRLNEDVLAWAFEKNGRYSLKSAYKLLKKDQMAAAMAFTAESETSVVHALGVHCGGSGCPPRLGCFGGGCCTILYHQMQNWGGGMLSENATARCVVIQKSLCTMSSFSVLLQGVFGWR